MGLALIRDGKWVEFETTVCWLETDPNDEYALVEVTATFASVEERQEYIKDRIEEGVVYDLFWFTESNYGGDPNRYSFSPVEETVENGFA